MNAFFKVVAGDGEQYSGVVFGTDQIDIMRKMLCYDPIELTFQFGECYQDDIVEIEDLKNNPLFDFS